MGNNKALVSDFNLFERLFTNHFEELCAYAYSVVPDIDIAKDIVQEVFLALWQDKEKYTLTRALLYTSVRHRAIDLVRSYHYRNNRPLSPLEKQVGALIIAQEEEYDISKLSIEIDHCIKSLPPQCQKVFIMSRHEELKNKEIADLLEISSKAVEKHISKAISQIKRHLTQRGLYPIIIWICLFVFG